MNYKYTTLSCVLIIVSLLIALCVLSFVLGRSHRENKSLKMTNSLVPSGKMKLISETPYIAELNEFLTPEECAHLIHLGEKKGMKQSQVGVALTDRKTDDNSRTSWTSYLVKGQDDIVKRIETRCALVALHPLTHMEPLQIVRYSHGEYFKEHHDYFRDEDVKNKKGPKYQRTITIFIYLNDLPKDEKGGSTYFPESQPKRKVRPQMGKAVLFRDLLPNGKVDAKTKHAALPLQLQKSVKYGCNVWMTTENYETHREK